MIWIKHFSFLTYDKPAEQVQIWSLLTLWLYVKYHFRSIIFFGAKYCLIHHFSFITSQSHTINLKVIQYPTVMYQICIGDIWTDNDHLHSSLMTQCKQTIYNISSFLNFWKRCNSIGDGSKSLKSRMITYII